MEDEIILSTCKKKFVIMNENRLNKIPNYTKNRWVCNKSKKSKCKTVINQAIKFNN